MKKIKSSVLALCTLSVLVSCGEFKESLATIQGKSLNKTKTHRVTNETHDVNALLGDSSITLGVLSESVAKNQILGKGILPVSDPLAQKMLNALPQAKTEEKARKKSSKLKLKSDSEDSLLLAFPIDLIGEENIFGGVITKVSDKTSENLGMLKLTDFPAVHTRPLILQGQDGSYSMVLTGCASYCDENSPVGQLLSLPIVGVNNEARMIIVDLAPIGQELDLVSMMDPTGGYTKLKAISSTTTTFEYSLSTLVFDVKTKMIPLEADTEDPKAPITEFTVRWFMRLSSVFNPAFASRVPTKGVGFFETTRGAETKITRFAAALNGKSIHYFIKNVPEEWKSTFGGALDNWNSEFKKVLGREVLTYQFLDANDPRANEVVTGDIRYNTIEWDLENVAPYGGLGPSIANQFTGETMSAHVLIQGPKIIELYTKWFEVSKKATELKAKGQTKAAQILMKEFNLSSQKEIARLKQRKFKLKLGELDMIVNSQRAELEDPILKGDFEIVPAGYSYEEYMKGYFSEMLEHELGHNLGLRHNFRGNLGAIENGEKGTVSRSIMEYLGRGYRHINAIGLYDRMAIAYGYKGVAPKHLNWFCTDEDEGSTAEERKTASPECSKSDATSDPYSFWEGRLSRAIDLLIETKSNQAPVWKLKEIAEKVDEAVTGLSAYALSAEATADTWTNFFGKADRPEDKSEVKTYVLQSLKDKLCDPKLAKIIAGKESEEAKLTAQTNLDELKKAVEAKTASFNLYSTAELGCE